MSTGSTLRDALVEDGSRRILVRVDVVRDVHVPREQDFLAQAHVGHRRDDAIARDVRPVPDPERNSVPAFLDRLEPAARADEHVAADGDPPLSEEPDRRLERGTTAELGKRAGGEDGEAAAPRTPNRPDGLEERRSDDLPKRPHEPIIETTRRRCRLLYLGEFGPYP